MMNEPEVGGMKVIAWCTIILVVDVDIRCRDVKP